MSIFKLLLFKSNKKMQFKNEEIKIYKQIYYLICGNVAHSDSTIEQRQETTLSSLELN